MDERETLAQIEELQHAYVECLDEDRLEEWPQFFSAQGCFYQIISRENVEQNLPVAVMRCDSIGMMTDRVVALRNANIYAKHYYRHLVSNLRVVGRTDATVQTQSNYAVFQTLQDGETHIYQVGRYLDEIVWEDGVAKFKSKRVIFDTARVRTLLATPI